MKTLLVQVPVCMITSMCRVFQYECACYMTAEVCVVYSEDKMVADLWLLNSCTVKSPAEDHFRNAVEEGRQLGKYVVLAGCVPQAQPKSDYIEV